MDYTSAQEELDYSYRLDALFNLLEIAGTVTGANLCILAQHNNEWGQALILHNGKRVAGVDCELLVIKELYECKNYNDKYYCAHQNVCYNSAETAIRLDEGLILVPVILPNGFFYGCIYLSALYDVSSQELLDSLSVLADIAALIIHLYEVLSWYQRSREV